MRRMYAAFAHVDLVNGQDNGRTDQDIGANSELRAWLEAGCDARHTDRPCWPPNYLGGWRP